jgi:hypothetical protein
MFSYWKLVPFLCAFLEHVFLGYTFVLSLLGFVGARFLMLEACTVFSCFFRAGDPRQKVCIVFACFCLEACTVFISFW